MQDPEIHISVRFCQNSKTEQFKNQAATSFFLAKFPGFRPMKPLLIFRGEKCPTRKEEGALSRGVYHSWQQKAWFDRRVAVEYSQWWRLAQPGRKKVCQLIFHACVFWFCVYVCACGCCWWVVGVLVGRLCDVCGVHLESFVVFQSLTFEKINFPYSCKMRNTVQNFSSSHV